MQFKKTMKLLIYIIFISISIPFLLGFFNGVHPLFDSFSHFRIHLLLMLLPVMLLLAFFHKAKNRIAYFLLIAMGTFYLYFITQPFVAQTPDKEKTNKLKHIQFNLNFRNRHMDEVLKYFEESSADVITLEEVTVPHQQALGSIKETYPYQAYCEFYPVVGGIAILSKHPFVPEKSSCLKGRGLLWTQILVNQEPINIVAIHTLWPYPHGQPAQIQEIKSVFKDFKGLTLIAGDFNAAPWSYSVDQIAEASNTKVIDGLRWTIDLKKQLPLFPNFKLPIDQVLLSDEFQVEKIFVEKSLGSDHLPVVSTIRY